MQALTTASNSCRKMLLLPEATMAIDENVEWSAPVIEIEPAEPPICEGRTRPPRVARRSERMPSRSPTISIRIINSGSIEGRPNSL